MDRPHNRRLLLLACLCVTIVQVTSSLAAEAPVARVTRASHPDHAHGSGRGGGAAPGSPQVTNNFEVVSHISLGGRSGDADVFYFDHGSAVGQFAYVGTAGDFCTGQGPKIVDVANPAQPSVVAKPRLQLKDVTYEDPAVIPIGGSPVLAVGVQACGDRGRGGLALFDVNDPRKPGRLAFFPTVSGGVHELDLTTLPDGRVAALLAVPFGEDAGGKDFQVIDISNPRKPKRISGWGVVKDSSLPIPSITDPPSSPGTITTCCQGIGTGFADFYFHSARAADGGRTAYVSHWDLGVLKFDLTDPANPRVVGRTVYPFGAEGEAHSLTTYESGGVRYILQNDEDFFSSSPAHVRTSATGDKRWAIADAVWMPTPLVKAGLIEAPVRDAGDGCDPADYRGSKGKIALADFRSSKPRCELDEQIALAGRSGAKAFLSNVTGRDRPSGAFAPPGDALRRIRAAAPRMPALAVASMDGLATAVRRAPGQVTMTLEPGTPEYGHLRVFSEENPTDSDGDGVVEYRQVGEFAGLPHVRGEYVKSSKQLWTIHNTEVWGNRAFVSWYAHGIVALDLTNPASPALVGQFAPPGDAGRKLPHLSKRLPAVWGVALDPQRGLIYASDIRSGLWIIRPTGTAMPPA